MAEYEEFLIGDLKTGLFVGKEPWLAPPDAFPTLENVCVDKGVLRRRRGYELIKEVGGWIERQPAGDVERIWISARMDGDGSNLIAGVFQGDVGTDRLYTSSNYGVSWTERQPAGAVDKGWTAVASDSDGSFLVAGAWAGRLYTSANSGVAWTERQPAGDADKNWRSVDCSSDGSVIIAAISNSRIYISTDSGVTWAETQPDGNNNRAWQCVRCDADGSVMIACCRLTNGGKVFVSTNSGGAWTEKQPAGATTKDWYTVATDSDGSVLIAGEYSGRLWLSTNSGSTWTEIRPHGADRNDNWIETALDSDGSVILATVQHRVSPTVGTLLWYSTDSGSTWTSKEFDNSDITTAYCDCDSDGSNMIVGTGEALPDDYGRLYTYQPILPVVGINKIAYSGYNEVIACTTRQAWHVHAETP